MMLAVTPIFCRRGKSGHYRANCSELTSELRKLKESATETKPVLN